MGDDGSRTELYELGRVKLIERLTKDIVSTNKSTVYGVGDDSAVLSSAPKQTVVSTGLMLEGIHFDLTYFPLKHLGYKAVVASISNIYAMNAQPTQILVALGVSKRLCVEQLDELYAGIRLACKRYGVDIVGGDTTSSYTGLSLAVTAIGEVAPDALVYRHGAQFNDLICVSGNFGAAYMGQQLLEREKLVFEANPNMQPQFQGHDYVLERILKPEAPRHVVKLLCDNGIRPTSMIDVSDCLSSALLHICKSSGVGCRIYFDRLPIDAQAADLAREFNIEPHVAALNGGEDYELLFTVPLRLHDTVSNLQGISVIGHITEAETGAYVVPENGPEIKLSAQGWNSVKTSE